MIVIDRLNKFFNKNKSNQVHALKNVSLELPDCGMVAIFGKSGCGKTTLLNAIGGLDSVQSGSVRINSEMVSPSSDTVRNKQVGYIFQNYCLNKDQTVYENVACALRLCGINDEDFIHERVMNALEQVGMEKYVRRTPDALSGGQQQRVAIARAIVKSPSIILADEPTGNIDEKNTVAIMDLLKAISKSSLVILVTHEAKLVDYYCDKIIELRDGEIISVRDNTNANGYVKRDKNAVYLGELDCESSELSGIDLEYYGEKSQGLRLRIVNAFGKIYIEASGADVKLIEPSGEIKLVEGRYTQNAETQEAPSSQKITLLPSFEGKRYGRLFTLANSLSNSAREYFAFSKRKKNRLLSVCLMFLSAIIVVNTAGFGIGIKEYINVLEAHNDNIFYLPVTSDIDSYEFVRGAMENGVEYAGLMRNPEMYSSSYASFYKDSFITGASFRLEASADVVSLSLAKDLPVIAGSTEIKEPFDLVISRTIADQLLKGSPVSFISDYEDLIGMSYFIGQEGTLVGIVDCEDKYFYLDDKDAAYSMLFDNYIYPNVMPYSMIPQGYCDSIAPGETAVFTSYGASFSGSQITAGGRSFKVTDIQRLYFTIDEYHEYVKDLDDILPFEKYCSSLQESHPEITSFQALSQWIFEHYFTKLPEFVSRLDNTTYIPLEWWVLKDHFSPKMLYYTLFNTSLYALMPQEFSLDTVYAAYLYKVANGSYPESDDLLDSYYEQIPSYDQFWSEITQYESEFIAQNNDGKYSMFNYEYTFVLSDEDYSSLAYSVGSCSSEVFCNIYGYSDEYPMYYIMMLSGDRDATQGYLASSEYAERVLYPEEYKNILLEERSELITGNIISLMFVLGLVCLFVYFIMKSVMMGKVKEIGIYRAIGVSRKNLVFRSFIDANFITFTTVAVGYLLSTVFISRLSESFVFEQMLYFPVWFAIVTFALVYIICIFFGLLPIISLMRKTPSAIIAKYDI